MSHIRGDEIVNGNADHCINLLQILQQISQVNMMQGEEESENQASQVNNSASQQNQGKESLFEANDGGEDKQ